MRVYWRRIIIIHNVLKGASRVYSRQVNVMLQNIATIRTGNMWIISDLSLYESIFDFHEKIYRNFTMFCKPFVNRRVIIVNGSTYGIFYIYGGITFWKTYNLWMTRLYTSCSACGVKLLWQSARTMVYKIIVLLLAYIEMNTSVMLVIFAVR